MASSMKEAFELLAAKIQRPVSLSRLSSTPRVTVSTFMSPSNYSRILAGPGSTSIPGFEFTFTVENLKRAGFPLPIKREDVIIDPELGRLSIKEVDAVWGLQAELIAFRVRTG